MSDDFEPPKWIQRLAGLAEHFVGQQLRKGLVAVCLLFFAAAWAFANSWTDESRKFEAFTLALGACLVLVVLLIANESFQFFLRLRHNNSITKRSRSARDADSLPTVFLSFMECQPASHLKTQKEILRKVTDWNAKPRNPNVQALAIGAITGEDDNFILFEAPSTRAGVEFIGFLRQQLSPDFITSINSKLLIYDKNFCNEMVSPDEGQWYLILVKCKPDKVADAFTFLTGLASKDPGTHTARYFIKRVAAILGSYDLFFTVQTPELNAFLTEMLGHQQVLQNYQVNNTTTCTVLDFANEGR